MCFGGSSNADPPLNSRPVKNLNQIPPKTSRMPQEVYAPPAGPPPSYQNQYAPPPGPPPTTQEQYAPPPRPPPPQVPQHDWQTTVPDTSGIGPPPSFGQQESLTNNATPLQAESAKRWLKNFPIQENLNVNSWTLSEINQGFIKLTRPSNFVGVLESKSSGVCTARAWRTENDNLDSCLISTLPLYCVNSHSPLRFESPKTIYYEVKLLESSRAEISLALGFVAMPYPDFRQPGWERGSLGVHGDDGSRYVVDDGGGKDFTKPFVRSQTVGIGMTFERREAPVPISVKVFFTRNGVKDGEWNIHDAIDVNDLSPTGLEGYHDLYPAVGTFKAVDFEVHFLKKDWLYKF